jgi:hypothetical protein
LAPEPLFDTITNNLLPIMKAYGDANKKIWILEHGYNTATATPSHGAGVSEAVQADYLKRAYIKAKTIPQIEMFYYYSWMNASTWDASCNCPVTDPTEPEHNYGLVRIDNSEKPAFQSYKQVAMATPIATSNPTSTASPASSPPPTLKPGDANNDGRVDGVDYVVWLNHYGQNIANGNLSGDFNADSKVDGVDYVIWMNYFGK